MSRAPRRRRPTGRARRCEPLFGLLLLAGLHAGPAHSANGMVSPGNGAVQLGMAGAGTAMAEDAAATLRNPAAGAWLDSGLSADLGIAIADGGFRIGALPPDSSMGLLDLSAGKDTSVQGVFPIPSFARNWRIDDRVAVGWGFMASGLKALSRGSSATLARGIPLFEAHCEGTFGGGSPLVATTDLSDLCGERGDALGVSLTQILVSAHGARRLTPHLSLGIAPVLAVQWVNVRGVGAFAAFSNRPDQMTDNKTAFSYGGGVRLGLLWEILPGVGLGLAYQSRIFQTDFDRYRGVIVGGGLDLPATLNAGLQIHLAPGQRLLLDAEQIRYGDIAPLSHQVDPQRFTDGCFVPRLLWRSLPDAPPLDACLGGKSGPGFGWQSVTVYKLGYQGRNGRLSYRAGYSVGGNPLVDDQFLSAVFAPAVTDEHASIGMSWRLSPALSLDWALLYSVKNTVRSRNAFSNVTLAISPQSIVGFKVDRDAADQTIEADISIWQSHFGLTWTPGRLRSPR